MSETKVENPRQPVSNHLENQKLKMYTAKNRSQVSGKIRCMKRERHEAANSIDKDLHRVRA